MSYTTLYAVNNRGVCHGYREYRNSWGAAAFVWNALVEKYWPLKPGQKSWERPVGMGGDMKPVWALAKQQDLPVYERVVLITTFDNMMIRREDFNFVADCFEQFDVALNPNRKIPFEDTSTPQVACHMMAFAFDFRKLADDKKVCAVCFQQTSVSDDMWYDYSRKKPYNIYSKGNDKHWFLFDEYPDLRNPDLKEQK